jgi:hypothetical protein
VTGLQNATGIQGLTGAQGLTGVAGVTGLQNATGIQGLTGTQGLTGVAGVTGLQGVTGLRGLTGAQGLTGVAGVTGLQGVTGAQYASGSINVIFDGGGVSLTTGIKGDVKVPFNIAFTQWHLYARETGSVLVGVWRASDANFPPTSSNAVHVGATGPFIGLGIKNSNSSIAGWTGAAAGDILRFNLNTVTGIQLLDLSLFYNIV